MNTKEKILHLFKSTKDLSVKEIVDKLMVSKQGVHLALNQLLEEKKVQKFGRTPKTIYRLFNDKQQIISHNKLSELPEADIQLLESKMLLISEIGEFLTGISAFERWCEARKQPIDKTFVEFKQTLKKYEVYQDKNGMIDGMPKLKNTKGYDKIYLDKLYYLDFYAIERFGKTRLGTLLHYAKQGQNKMLMMKIVEEIRTKINTFIAEMKADAIAFVPPTIRREVQIMKFLETHLQIHLPVVKIQKISGLIPVPQKSLNKLEERIRNADNTFAINETVKYKHVILFDDAVGSGSTLNQIAGKLKEKKIAMKITGVAIVGSFKGFDVITDI